jgi:predicted regulator of Ras-like GTPase activity (Roadblock/LC7/MglB family)
MNPFRAVVESLAMQPGVRGAVIAAPDGVIVESVVHADVRADEVAAFGSAVLARARTVTTAVALSSPRCVAIDAQAGRLCLTSNDEVAIIVLAEPRAPIGRLRIALRQALESLA